MTTMDTTTATTAATTDAANKRDGARSAGSVEPSQGGRSHHRHSPDPMQATDRYRLVTPYALRLR